MADETKVRLTKKDVTRLVQEQMIGRIRLEIQQLNAEAEQLQKISPDEHTDIQRFMRQHGHRSFESTYHGFRFSYSTYDSKARYDNSGKPTSMTMVLEWEHAPSWFQQRQVRLDEIANSVVLLERRLNRIRDDGKMVIIEKGLDGSVEGQEVLRLIKKLAIDIEGDLM